MDEFNIWGQVQEISSGRYLVIATSCPVKSGRQTSFSTVVASSEDARLLLGRLVARLERQVAANGGSVRKVHRLSPYASGDSEPHAPHSRQGEAGGAERHERPAASRGPS